MTHSVIATETRWTHQKSSRDGAKIDRFIVHHAANTSVEQTLRLFAGAREVSANYALGNGRVVAAVREEDRAWTSGSPVDDKRAVTVEVSNSRLGDPWPVADVEFDNLARLIADVANRYGFPINDNTILTHQELWTRFGRSYPTACPGDLQRRKGELINLARKYQGSAPTPNPVPDGGGSGASEDSYPALSRYGTDWVINTQKDLISLGHDLAPWGADGKDGAKTQAAVKKEQKAAGLTADGIAGTDTRRAMDRKMAKLGKIPAFPLPSGYWFGAESGPVQSVSGYHGNSYNVARYQQRLKDRGWHITVDGLWGSNSDFITREFQKEKGLRVDGQAGIATWNAAWTSPVTPAQ